MSFPFKIPFAASGDQSTVPDSDLTGSVNFTDGYTPDYQADPSLDPNAKLIERDKFNFLMNKITGAVGEIQRQGAADWYADLAPYDLNAEVFYNGKRWRSTIANNSATPEAGSEWLDVTPGTAASKDVATPAEAIAGTPDKLTDAAGVHAAFNQYGLGSTVPDLNINDGTSLETTFFAASQANGSPIASTVYGVQIAETSNSATRFFGRGSSIYAQSVESGVVASALSLFHSGNMEPDRINGLNSPRLMRNVSGATVGSEGDAAGSGLRFCDFSTTGVITASTNQGSGTWRNISGTSLDANEYGLFVRIA